MDFELSPRQRAFRSEFEAFCDERIAPHASEANPEGYEVARIDVVVRLRRKAR